VNQNQYQGLMLNIEERSFALIILAEHATILFMRMLFCVIFCVDVSIH
jgi:NADH dehydrogenase.